MRPIYYLLGMSLIPFYLLLSGPSTKNAVNAQPINNSIKSQNETFQDTYYYSLLPPLNIIKSTKVVDENPKLNLSDNKAFQSLTKEYGSLFNTQFVPFQFYVNKNGIIENVKIYNDIAPKPFTTSQKSSIDVFLNKLIGIQLTTRGAIKQGETAPYTAVLSFIVTNNQLILNPILH